LPLEEQKAMRKGKTVSNLIFKKGRSEKLPYQLNKEKPLPLIQLSEKIKR
jgi:hypothetical protein